MSIGKFSLSQKLIDNLKRIKSVNEEEIKGVFHTRMAKIVSFDGVGLLFGFNLTYNNSTDQCYSTQFKKAQDDKSGQYKYIILEPAVSYCDNYCVCIECSSYNSLCTNPQSKSITIVKPEKQNFENKQAIIKTNVANTQYNVYFIFAEDGDPTNLINFITSNGTPITENRNGDSKMEDNTTIGMIANEIEIKHTKQLVLTGAPGTGKTYSAKKYVEEYIKKQGDDYWNGIMPEKNYGFVQFHSSYSYTDFVEGLRPVMLSDRVSFVRMDGVFKEFCRRVVEYGNEKCYYFFIIDEINRADLSKVFGELMFGLEDSYRGGEHKFDTQYKNLPTYHYKEEDGTTKKVAVEIEKDDFADGFYIPKNVIIIGTMNDIDRSVEAFDFALRRRFRWINVKANDIMMDSLKGILLRSGEAETENKGLNETEITELANAAIELNKTISRAGESLGLNDDYHIGPAYYKHFTSETDKEEYFISYLEPILREYVRGRKPEKINDFISKCKSAFRGTKTQDGSEADGKVNYNG